MYVCLAQPDTTTTWFQGYKISRSLSWDLICSTLYCLKMFQLLVQVGEIWLHLVMSGYTWWGDVGMFVSIDAIVSQLQE